MAAPLYLHLPNGAPLPSIGPAPFKALLIAESIVMEDWRSTVCAWLARSGCRYFISWGQDCEAWQDVMAATAAAYRGGAMAEDFMMTASHAEESLAHAMWSSVHDTEHPSVAFQGFVIAHVTPRARHDEILVQFADAVRDD